jgi:DNA-binding NtrC family response regulator
VVDDEPGALKLFRAALARDEFVCRFATTGEEALDEFERSPTDLLLVDKNLPGIDGLELIRRVQRLDKTCEAVLVTAYASLESALVAMDLRTADFLTKPLHHVNLVPATLKKAARRRDRRLLARRMVDDLKQAIHARATDADWSHVVNARRRWEQFRDLLAARRTVLFADLHAEAVRPAAEFLAQNGYGVPWVRNGKDALARCRSGDTSVIIIGDELADESPFELFEQLLELTARPEVILTSRGASMHDVINALSRGASGYVVEPITDMEVLARKVERAYLEHRERLLQFKLVAELRRLVDNLGEHGATERVRHDIESALAGFDMAAAQVAVRLYESQVGESAWEGGESGGNR